MINAILINEKDNVGTAVKPLKAGETASYLTREGAVRSVCVREDIPVFHKFALFDISRDAPIIKYGEHIGFAKDVIEAGQYVHIHNLYSKRENLVDKRAD